MSLFGKEKKEEGEIKRAAGSISQNPYPVGWGLRFRNVPFKIKYLL